MARFCLWHTSPERLCIVPLRRDEELEERARMACTHVYTHVYALVYAHVCTHVHTHHEASRAAQAGGAARQRPPRAAPPRVSGPSRTRAAPVVAWRGAAWRGAAWRGLARLGAAWRGLMACLRDRGEQRVIGDASSAESSTDAALLAEPHGCGDCCTICLHPVE